MDGGLGRYDDAVARSVDVRGAGLPLRRLGPGGATGDTWPSSRATRARHVGHNDARGSDARAAVELAGVVAPVISHPGTACQRAGGTPAGPRLSSHVRACDRLAPGTSRCSARHAFRCPSPRSRPRLCLPGACARGLATQGLAPAPPPESAALLSSGEARASTTMCRASSGRRRHRRGRGALVQLAAAHAGGRRTGRAGRWFMSPSCPFCAPRLRRSRRWTSIHEQARRRRDVPPQGSGLDQQSEATWRTSNTHSRSRSTRTGAR